MPVIYVCKTNSFRYHELKDAIQNTEDNKNITKLISNNIERLEHHLKVNEV